MSILLKQEQICSSWGDPIPITANAVACVCIFKMSSKIAMGYCWKAISDLVPCYTCFGRKTWSKKTMNQCGIIQEYWLPLYILAQMWKILSIQVKKFAEFWMKLNCNKGWLKHTTSRGLRMLSFASWYLQLLFKISACYVVDSPKNILSFMWDINLNLSVEADVLYLYSYLRVEKKKITSSTETSLFFQIFECIVILK